jgi:hypothetical protein
MGATRRGTNPVQSLPDFGFKVLGHFSGFEIAPCLPAHNRRGFLYA